MDLASPRGGDITAESLISQYYMYGTQMSGKKIPIKDVMDIPLRPVSFTIQRVEGSHASHQDSWEHMLYSLLCMAPIVFN